MMVRKTFPVLLAKSAPKAFFSSFFVHVCNLIRKLGAHTFICNTPTKELWDGRLMWKFLDFKFVLFKHKLILIHLGFCPSLKVSDSSSCKRATEIILKIKSFLLEVRRSL